MKTTFGFGKESVVISNYVSGIPGGRNLNVEGYEGEVINGGHIIIAKDGDYKPMPVKNGEYDALPEGYAYCGVLVSGVLTSKPFASIMTQGQVLEGAMPYGIDGIKEALKTALPGINFIKE